MKFRFCREGSLGVTYALLFKPDAEKISTNLVQKVAENILTVNNSGVFFDDFQLEGNKTNAFQYSGNFPFIITTFITTI